VTALAAPAAPVELDPLEIHTGILLGEGRTRADIERLGFDGATPAQVLEDVLTAALERTPCLVAFSGGRDSSALLAAATHLARLHGLHDPIPLTLRFPQHPRTEEARWQELVMKHLGLSEWHIVDHDQEFDVIGPVARTALRTHGLYWPPNAHNLVPLLQSASGGALVTGNGGDELFTPWLWFRVSRIRRGRMLPRRIDLKPLAFSYLPRAGRQVAYERLSHFGPPWLRPSATRALRRRYAADLRFGNSWRADLEAHLTSRYCEVVRSTFGLFAADAGAMLVEPFLDSRYVRAVGHHAPRDGFASRGEAMAVHFGELLPERVLTRSDKAVFTEVSSGYEARAFAENWDGSGIDESLADPEVVRSIWLSERPSMQSLTMLQAAYLACGE
jgi:asparagine synthase (glutamine-hydrolysing)